MIANEFAEAIGDLHRSALIEIGLALFIVTIIVNALARMLVWAVTRGTPARHIKSKGQLTVDWVTSGAGAMRRHGLGDRKI